MVFFTSKAEAEAIEAKAAAAQQLLPAAAPAPVLAPQIPIAHQAHPFWQGFNWMTALQVLQGIATVAPVVVAAFDKDPAAEKAAAALGSLTSAAIGGMLAGQQTPQ